MLEATPEMTPIGEASCRLCASEGHEAERVLGVFCGFRLTYSDGTAEWVCPRHVKAAAVEQKAAAERMTFWDAIALAERALSATDVQLKEAYLVCSRQPQQTVRSRRLLLDEIARRGSVW